MSKAKAPIGVMDTGVGGFTVARELQRQLPNEDILYLGDTFNQPYGNRSEEQILDLTVQLLTFLQEKGIKALAVACNTISTLIDQYQDRFPFPMFSVVQAGSDMAVARGLRRAGVISTMFTASTGCYPRLIAQKAPQMLVTSRGCVDLGGFIEHDFFDREKIDENLCGEINALLAQGPIDALILGCTHYPLVSESIHRLFPSLLTLDPAEEQARQIGEYLKQNGLQNPSKEKGRFVIYTSADCEKYREVARIAGLYEPDEVVLIPAPVLSNSQRMTQ